ncbi:unnamed protein product [Heligmosomoides polygyrus]|uniref:WWE domain-containing protein n=1 Tax=Heligmosomoides polygyrus TaxID=6339 RepID=A0A183G9I4_HELPZ|nr:unnamed protein product [Heligmosomoides polygyrus]
MLWDQYWSLDSTEESWVPNQAENRRIWDQFHATVERHGDGYHVRLPWKDAVEDLPDNRTIPYNRLRSVLSKFRSQLQLLSQYHGMFQEQLSKEIIDEVDQDAQPDGKKVHYLAQQAVVRDITKLRFVFDGSAHHKDTP